MRGNTYKKQLAYMKRVLYEQRKNLVGDSEIARTDMEIEELEQKIKNEKSKKKRKAYRSGD